MTDEPLERDPALADALSGIAGNDFPGNADLTSLRRAISATAASELTRRRRPRRLRAFIPAGLAAGIAVFLLVRGFPNQPSLFGPQTHSVSAPTGQTAVNGQASIEELLDANLSDGQFRALVSGATDANDLLLIAAEESQ